MVAQLKNMSWQLDACLWVAQHLIATGEKHEVA